LVEFCINENELVDFEKVAWMNDIINYIPGIISKDKNISNIDFVLKGEDKYKFLRQNCNNRVEKLMELINFALKQRFD
jgi:hypothetical protein